MNLMVTTSPNLVIDTQQIKRKEYKHNTKESQQTTERRKREKNREELQKKKKSIMGINTYYK